MRREFPAKVKLAAWERCQIDGKPHCERCHGLIVGRAEYDHDKADGLGGEPTLENCKVLCTKCHTKKTHTEDRPIMLKADRQIKKAAGIKRSKSVMPGSRASRFKRKINGETELR